MATAETTALVEKEKRLPTAVPSDHETGSRNSGRNGAVSFILKCVLRILGICRKGKVERCNQNLNREFIDHLESSMHIPRTTGLAPRVVHSFPLSQSQKDISS